MESLNVNLGEKSYTIEIAENAFSNAVSKAAQLAALGKKNVFITDENVKASHSEKLEQISKFGSLIVLPAGETTKSFANFEMICEKLADLRLNRKSALFAIGGGVVGDITGFAAASYMRGIDFYQVPTTLLSMVDSSVGGKTGINLKAGKNLVGAFHQPKAVYIDTSFLDTLPKREIAAGMAEVIKYALICDAEFFDILNGGNVLECRAKTAATIKRCCAIKADVVSKDEFENSPENGRALLNLGHTFGHAIENCAGYGVYLHGEAVGIGLLMAAKLSEKLGLAKDISQKTRVLLEKYAIPVKIDKSLSSAKLVDAMHKDKKSHGAKLRFVLMRGIGKSFTTEYSDERELQNLFESFK